LDEGTVAVCIADVCGKGMPAAMMVSNLQAAVRTYASRRVSPRELCELVNRVMCENIAAHRFITLFFGVISAARNRLTCGSAGHHPTILATREGSIKRLNCGGGVLGFSTEWQYEQEEVRLSSGDRILMFTDGITESRNPAGEDFGEARLADL